MNVYRLRNIFKSYFCEKSDRITVIIIFILNDPEKNIFSHVYVIIELSGRIQAKMLTIIIFREESWFGRGFAFNFNFYYFTIRIFMCYVYYSCGILKFQKENSKNPWNATPKDNYCACIQTTYYNMNSKYIFHKWKHTYIMHSTLFFFFFKLLFIYLFIWHVGSSFLCEGFL